MKNVTRREFIKSIAVGGAALGLGNTIASVAFPRPLYALERPVVSVVAIKNDKVDYAVQKAIDLLGVLRHWPREKSGSCSSPTSLVSRLPM